MGTIKDITGQKFGKLTVVEKSHFIKGYGWYWICQCECGNTKIAWGYYLRKGKTHHCGCVKKMIDISGKKFGKLTAIKPSHQDKDSIWLWVCKCDCGNTVTVSGTYLKGSRLASCGCNRIIDITGKRFGKLTVIGKADKYGSEWKWRCKCDCGGESISRGGALRFGHTKSCGCLFTRFLGKGVSSFNDIYRVYMQSAKKRNYKWNINKKEFKKIINQDCHYCGAKPQNIRKTNERSGPYVYNGIDRVDNNIGYELNNLVPCCTACNKLKGFLPVDEFLNRIKMIFQNLNL